MQGHTEGNACDRRSTLADAPPPVTLRRLPQPLHLLEYTFRSQHYHFGWFEAPSEDLRVAQDRLSQRAIAPVAAARTVLDIGCGLGGTSCLLARAGARVTAMDCCPESIAFARQVERTHGAPHPVRFAAEPFAAFAACEFSPFEAAVAIEVQQHFPDLRTFLAQCAAVLAPGGTLVLLDVATDLDLEWARVPFHRRGAVDHHAPAAGFAVLDHADITREVEPTLPAMANGLASHRSALLEFFGAGGNGSRQRVQDELDQVLGHIHALQDGFANRHLHYESSLLRRR